MRPPRFLLAFNAIRAIEGHDHLLMVWFFSDLNLLQTTTNVAPASLSLFRSINASVLFVCLPRRVIPGDQLLSSLSDRSQPTIEARSPGSGDSLLFFKWFPQVCSEHIFIDFVMPPLSCFARVLTAGKHALLRRSILTLTASAGVVYGMNWWETRRRAHR